MTTSTHHITSLHVLTSLTLIQKVHQVHTCSSYLSHSSMHAFTIVGPPQHPYTEWLHMMNRILWNIDYVPWILWKIPYVPQFIRIRYWRKSWNDIIDKVFVMLKAIEQLLKELSEKGFIDLWSSNIDLVLRGPRTNHWCKAMPPASKPCHRSSIMLLELRSMSFEVDSGCCSGCRQWKSDGWWSKV